MPSSDASEEQKSKSHKLLERTMHLDVDYHANAAKRIKWLQRIEGARLVCKIEFAKFFFGTCA